LRLQETADGAQSCPSSHRAELEKASKDFDLMSMTGKLLKGTKSISYCWGTRESSEVNK
jgi:hypothetical protein